MKITKEQYIELTKFVELSSFEGRNVIDDIDIIFRNLNMGAKTYVVFRDELIKDIQKNKHLFQSTEKDAQTFRNDNENNIRKSK